MLSIIIPTLNEEKYFPRLLESIEEQNFDNYEIIVADAGSKDKTREIAQQHGCKMVGGGMPAAGRNRGAKAAQGNLLLFVDADTILPNYFLRKALKEFEQRNLDVAASPLSFYDGGRLINYLVDVFCNWPVLGLEKILPFALSLILVKKDLHEKINGFDEEILLLEDIWYARQASNYGKFGVLRSTKFQDTVRRFEKEGYVKTYFKYILANIHLLIKGPIKTDIFNYKFNNYDKS